MKQWCELTTREKLQELLTMEKKLEHLEAHNSRMFFIQRVLDCYGVDPKFDKCVDSQLDLYCGYIHPPVFYEVCNDPRHCIRNKLIAWAIDHPTNDYDQSTFGHKKSTNVLADKQTNKE